MTVHELKVSEKWYSALWFGFKNFEVRKNDRNFQIGDTIILNEVTYDKDSKAIPTGRRLKAYIMFVLRAEDFPDGLKEGYCVLALSETVEEEKQS